MTSEKSQSNPQLQEEKNYIDKYIEGTKELIKFCRIRAWYRDIRIYYDTRHEKNMPGILKKYENYISKKLGYPIYPHEQLEEHYPNEEDYILMGIGPSNYDTTYKIHIYNVITRNPDEGDGPYMESSFDKNDKDE